MIAVSFTLGVCLFIKFQQADSTWCTFIGFCYLSVVFTGMYENRLWNLDASDPPVLQHRVNHQLGSEGPVTLSTRTVPKTYDDYHSFGVMLFVLCSFIGQIGWWHSTTDHQPGQSAAWWASAASIGMGAVFSTMNVKLTTPLPEKPGRFHEWIAGEADASTNKWRGITCITIELLTLLTSAAAGLLSQPIPRVA
jgi:hypothetical protein